MNLTQASILFDKLNYFATNKELIKLVLSDKRDKSSDLKNIIVNLVELKAGLRLQLIFRYNTKDITKNYPIEEGLKIVQEEFFDKFYCVQMYSNSEDVLLQTNRKGLMKLNITKPTLQPLTTFTHDRIKERLIETNDNIYLKELGITNANWQLRYEMTDKFKQINRYIELLAPHIKELKITDDFHVVDMGAGKGYLTFALYDYLQQHFSSQIKMTGVEFREDLVQTCNTIAQKSNFTNLKFVDGTIEKTDVGRIDMLIALHACDTATDEAIFRGITSNASLIVCAPCCHKQIRNEFNLTNELSVILKYGILEERQAEIITDGLRALIMEAFGYKTKVFEFISTEHTPKNILIVGQKTNLQDDKRLTILNNIAQIKKIYGIKKHYLETLLNI